MAKISTPKIPIENNENNFHISFTDTVKITSGDIDAVASRKAVRKFLDLGWGVADLNNIVPFPHYLRDGFVGEDVRGEFLKSGSSIKFLRDNLKHMAYAMEKQDEINRRVYTFPLNITESAERLKQCEQEQQRGQVSREEYISEGEHINKIVYLTYRGRRRKAPRLLFCASPGFFGTNWTLYPVEIPKELATLMLKLLPKHGGNLPIDYVVLKTPPTRVPYPIYYQAMNPQDYIFVELKANNSSENPKGRGPRACTWVNVKGEYFLCFSYHIYPALGQAKLESLKNHELARGYLFYLKNN